MDNMDYERVLRTAFAPDPICNGKPCVSVVEDLGHKIICGECGAAYEAAVAICNDSYVAGEFAETVLWRHSHYCGGSVTGHAC